MPKLNVRFKFAVKEVQNSKEEKMSWIKPGELKADRMQTEIKAEFSCTFALVCMNESLDLFFPNIGKQISL